MDGNGEQEPEQDSAQDAEDDSRVLDGAPASDRDLASVLAPPAPTSDGELSVAVATRTEASLSAASGAEPATADGADLAPGPDASGNIAPDQALVPVSPMPPATSAVRIRAVPLPRTRLSALLLAGSGLALVAAAAGLALALTGGDWGSGARAAGIACLALGLLCLGAYFARSLRSRHWVRPLGIAAVLAYGLSGGGALAAANPLRLAQGHTLEVSRDWPGALRAYLLAGEQGSASADPARVYLEWGDDLTAQGQPAAAVDRYEQVIVRYPRAQEQVRQAIARLWPAYAAWITAPSAISPYVDIIQHLHGYQRSTWCDSDCLNAAAALEAQARFAYGLELEGEGQYAQAVKWLESVRGADPISPYVARAHVTAATVYYALGQTQLHGPNCTAALPTFQALAGSYRDTPEGKRAAAALAAPVAVVGRLTGYPAWPAPTMYLSVKVYSTSHFSDDYSATLDGAGNFTFAQVKPGAYNLSAAFGDGSGRYWQSAQGNNLYAVAVAPLCALNLGTYSW